MKKVRDMPPVFKLALLGSFIAGALVTLILTRFDLYQFFAAVTAIGTLWVAMVTRMSAQAASEAANETRRAAQAQVLSNLLDEYSSQDMRKAIDALSTWFSEHNNSLADELRRFNGKQTSIPDDLNDARRKVSHHFQKIHIMELRAELLDKIVAEAALDKGQVQIYRELVEPLEWALTSSYNRTSFDYFGSKYRVHRRIIPGLAGWEE